MIDRSFLIEQSYRSLGANEGPPLAKVAELEKDALVPLLANAARFLGLGARAAPAARAAAGTAAEAASPGLIGHLTSLVGLGAKPGSIGYMMGKPLAWIPGIGGREGAATAMGFGGLSGAMGFAMPNEGEGRLESAVKGFGKGVLGGIGWEVGSRGLARGFDKFLAKPGSTFAKAKDLGWGNIWNRTSGLNQAKLLGAKGLRGAGWLAGGFAGNAVADHLYENGFTGKSSDPYSFKGFGATAPGGVAMGGNGSSPGGIQGGSYG